MHLARKLLSSGGHFDIENMKKVHRFQVIPEDFLRNLYLLVVRSRHWRSVAFSTARTGSKAAFPCHASLDRALVDHTYRRFWFINPSCRGWTSFCVEVLCCSGLTKRWSLSCLSPQVHWHWNSQRTSTFLHEELLSLWVWPFIVVLVLMICVEVLLIWILMQFLSALVVGRCWFRKTWHYFATSLWSRVGWGCCSCCCLL